MDSLSHYHCHLPELYNWCHLSQKGSPKIMEWVAYPFSNRSSWPRNWTGISCSAGGFFNNWAIREAWRQCKRATSGAEKNWTFTYKKVSLDTELTYFIKTNSKWIIYLYDKHKTTQHNIGENLCQLLAQLVKNLPASWISGFNPGLGRSLGKGKATHSSILA